MGRCVRCYWCGWYYRKGTGVNVGKRGTYCAVWCADRGLANPRSAGRPPGAWRLVPLPVGQPARMDRPLTLDEVERERRLDCVDVGACLAYASGQTWQGMSCNGCVSYQPQRDHEESYREVGALLGLAALILEAA